MPTRVPTCARRARDCCSAHTKARAPIGRKRGPREDFGHELLPNDLDRMERNLAQMVEVVTGARPCRHQAGGQRPDDLLARFESARRPLPRTARLLVCVWSDDRVQPGRGGGQGAERLDDRRRSRLRLLHVGRDPLRRVGGHRLRQGKERRRVHHEDSPDVPLRGAGGGASGAHHSRLPGAAGGRCGLRLELRLGSPVVVRAAGHGSEGRAHFPPAELVRPGGGRSQGDAPRASASSRSRRMRSTRSRAPKRSPGSNACSPTGCRRARAGWS